MLHHRPRWYQTGRGRLYILLGILLFLYLVRDQILPGLAVAAIMIGGGAWLWHRSNRHHH